MNIMAVHKQPRVSAIMLPDAHVVKMRVESVQMLVAALYINGCPENQMPLTKAGRFHQGGYFHHPCTVWASKTQENFLWLIEHAQALCDEKDYRYGVKEQTARKQLEHIVNEIQWDDYIPEGELQDFYMAMPLIYQDPADTVGSYRRYFNAEKQYKKNGLPNTFTRREPPEWWE